jgi:hypothetical protein
MQAQSIAYAPTWMRFYERAQAHGAFGALGDLDRTPAIFDPQALVALNDLFDFNAIAAAQPYAPADL